MVEIHKIAEAPKLLRAIANAGFMLQKYEVNFKKSDRRKFVDLM